MTLLDFPGKVACTVFLQGCNFRCPFCHNSDLLSGPARQPILWEELLRFLDKRRGLLDGVCITGGEPTLQKALPELLREIKARGFAVKLDTNGSRPEVLSRLLEDALVDYVAMDIKNGPSGYARTVGTAVDLEAVTQSMRMLLAGCTDYEFRTTVVEELHAAQDILEMGHWTASVAPGHKPKRFFLQGYVDRESVLFAGLHGVNREKMVQFQEILRPFAENVEIRGVD